MLFGSELPTSLNDDADSFAVRAADADAAAADDDADDDDAEADAAEGGGRLM